MHSILSQSCGRLEETRRISRVLEVIQAVTTRPRRYLRRDLAERYDVSERMIQKDLEIIRHALRLSLSHSPQGYYFEETPRLPALHYTFQEALALLIAVRAAQRVSGVGSRELADAVGRLEDLFPEEFIPYFKQTVSKSKDSAQDGRRQTITVLHHAMLEGRKIRITYRTSSRNAELTTRVVRPYHLMPYVRSWHLIAHCELRDSVRMFKLDRIQDAELLEDRYTIPQDFSIDDYLGMAWGVMRADPSQAVDIVLRFQPEAGRWVTEESWHKSQRFELQTDGTVLFHLHLPITPEFVNWILYYGSGVKVLEPQSLRERVAEEHRKAAGIYESNGI